MKRYKIVLVDDHPVVREGVAQFINAEPDLTVCAIANDASEAMQVIGAHSPALVVTDLSLSGRLGLELVKELAAKYPSVPVLVLSIHDEELWAERVLRAGAERYIMKSQATAEIVAAIRRIINGGLWVSPRVNEVLLQKQIQSSKPTKETPLDRLSDRELEVFHCIGRGMSMKEIADAFFLSSKTVEVHRDHVREKLGMRSSAELVRYAVSHLLADV